MPSFKSIKNKYDGYRGKACMKKFLREHAMETTNFKKKKMKLLTNKEQISYENAKICYTCKEKLEDKHAKDKNIIKLEIIIHYTIEYRSAAHSIYNLKYSVPKEISIFFHNWSKYDYHFIIRKLEFDGKCTCLGENTEKYITFSVPIKNEVYKNW